MISGNSRTRTLSDETRDFQVRVASYSTWYPWWQSDSPTFNLYMNKAYNDRRQPRRVCDPKSILPPSIAAIRAVPRSASRFLPQKALPSVSAARNTKTLKRSSMTQLFKEPNKAIGRS